MPKLAHNFVQGKMNKDLDERLVPPGQYRDALNIQVSTSEGSDVGAVENILGNTKLNKKSSSVNWAANFGLTSAQCIGAARDTQNNKLYWFVTSASVDAILEYDEGTGFVAPILVDTGTVLNFNAANFITGVNIFEVLLCWTDNLNEPRKILISRFKAGSTQGGTSINTHTQVYSRAFIASDITVIKKKPNERLHYAAASSTVTGVGAGLSRVTVKQNFTELFGGVKVPREVGSTINITTSEAPTAWAVNDIIALTAYEFNNDRNLNDQYQVRLKVTALPNANTPKFVPCIILSISSDMPDIELDWVCVLQEDPPMFEFSFPRFAYRWKYIDGEVSAFSPWTNAVFVPDTFEYGSFDAYNEGMRNNLRKLTLSNFETPPADVDKLQILYKDSSENIIYKIDEKAANIGSIAITSEVVTNVIESNQILRPYDNVPIKALAQEVIGNRIVYGNYVQNYDIIDEIDLSVSLQSVDITELKKPEESVKSLRDYQVGIVYVDKNGRETPVFTNSYSTVKLGIDKASKVNKLKADSGQDAPSWATHFKYYVKEVSNEYYNVSLDRYYADPDGFMWLSIPSAERNKVQEGDFLVLKKQHRSDLPVNEITRYKILDISNEAPEPIKTRRKFKVSAGCTRGTDSARIASGLKTFKFVGPNPNAGNSEFVSSLNQDVYVRFVSGANRTAFYEIESAGFTSDSANHYEITLNKKLSTYTWLGSATDITVEVHERRTDILPEYIGRFFVKINRDIAFDENIVYNFTNNPGDYQQDGVANPGVIVDNISDNPDVDNIFVVQQGWDDHADAQPNVTLFGKPTINSYKFGLVYAPWNGTSPIGGAGLQNFNTKAVAGAIVQFRQSTGGWSSLYEIASVTKGAYVRGTGAGGTSQGNDEGGYYWNYTLTTAYTDEDIDPNQVRVSVRKRTQPTVFDEDSDVLPVENPAIFEVEPSPAVDLDLYYEATEALPISQLSTEQTLDYFNVYSFGNGVESDRIRDDFNAKRIGKGVKVSSVIETEYKQERRKSGLIYSGLFNNTSGVNELNQFIQGLKITKDLNPIYGGIQLLKARDTDLVTLCEDKCFRIQANKDALFTADGNPNVTSTNNVLGQTIAYAGEFGISKNPESFTTYGFRSYFTDKARGTVIRLSMDGITEIAENGMSDYFEDKLKAASGAILGSYDEAAGSYNVSFSSDESVAFKEGVRGWTSRMSFVPEAAISLNNDYYTMKNGELWVHNSATRSNFYGTQANSTVTPIFNDAPSSIKNFKTLSYEGDAGWVADVLTDQQDGEVEAWKKKENLYFNYIKGKATTLSNIDSGEFAVQGLGNPTSTEEDSATIDGVSVQTYELVFPRALNVSLQKGDIVYFTDASDSDTVKIIGTCGIVSGNTVTVIWGAPFNEPVAQDFIFFVKDTEKNTSGVIGYHASVEMKTTSSDKKELFAVNSEVFISSE